MMLFLLLAGAMLLVLGAILGIVLFIVGLVKEKPSIWGSGIVLAVLTVLMFAGGIVALWSYLFVVVSSPQYAALAWDPNAVQAAKDLDAAGIYFQDCVGVTLPEGVSVVWQKTGSTLLGKDGGPNADICQYKLSVPADFEEFLAGTFTKTQWSDVEDAFMVWMVPFDDEIPPMPEEGRLRALPVYTFTQPENPNADATFTTSIVLDPNSREAWVVGQGWHKK